MEPSPSDPTPPSRQLPSANDRKVNPRLDSIGRFKNLIGNRWLRVILVLLVIAGILLTIYTGMIYGITALCIGVFVLVIVYPHDLLQAFAEANNYNYQEFGFLDNQTGIIFDIGYYPLFEDIVYGLYQNWPFFIFVYSYSLGYQDDSRRISQTVFVLDFLNPLPAFVLKKHGLFQRFEAEGEALSNEGYTQKLELEGDFDNYFQVYIKLDTQIEVLSILTPDVMEQVMKLSRYEIEITADGKLYVYCRGTINRKQDLLNTYSIVASLVNKIETYVQRELEIESVSHEQ